MIYSTLGNSDLKVSEIGFGCMSLPVREESISLKLIHIAMAEAGINFFDTADLYDKGLNEIILGKAITGRRDKTIVATKVGNEWRPDGSGWDWNPTKKYILQAAEQSLRRMRTDYIDLYQLHGGTIDDPIDDTIEAFEILKQQGKIRHYAISSIRPNVIREYVKRSAISSVMLQYSLADRRAEETVLPLLQQHKIGVLARGSLGQGLLVNKAAKQYLQHTEKEMAKLAEMIRELSTWNRSPAQTALRYALQNPAVTCTVAGCSNEQQLAELNGAIQSPSLSLKELELLNNTIAPGVYELHR